MTRRRCWPPCALRPAPSTEASAERPDTFTLPRRNSYTAELGGPAQTETEPLIQANRTDVGGRRVQERRLAPCPDARGDGEHQPGRQSPAPMGGVGADGADLGPARRVQPFTGHRHQHAAEPDAEVVAEFDGTRQE